MSWKNFHKHPEFSPVFVKNTWAYAYDIPMSSVFDTDDCGHTLLHLAVFGLKQQNVIDLIKKGADVHATTKHGFKPHHMLMTPMLVSNTSCQTTRKAIISILSVLIEYGAIDTRVFEGDNCVDNKTNYMTFSEYIENNQFAKKKADAFCVTDLIHTIPIL